MSDDDVELTILMPCLNEAETLGRCLDKAFAYLARSGVRGEVVVADNGSTDGSIEIAERAGARVVNVPLRGYGAALFAGAQAARGRFVVMGDSDDSYDFSALDPFLARLRDGDDLVMGNRFAGGIRPGAMPFKNRYLGNPVLSFLGRLFFGAQVRDFHCGLRGFSKRAFERMDLRTTGMEFASEMVIKATLLGMRVGEVPTTLDKDGRSRPPHLRPWRDGWRHLRFMLLYAPRWLFLWPGMLLISVCGALALALVPGPIWIGSAALDVHTQLYAMLGVLMGVQCVIFGSLARLFADQEGLAPKSPRLERLYRFISLETGLAIGALLLVGGSIGAIATFVRWSEADFGALPARESLRVTIPALFAMLLGTEIVMASFFASMLGLRVRR